MRKFYLVVLGILLGVSIFAQCVEPPEPPVANYLVADRIRNTPVVDPDVSGEGRRFYVTTFGLENFDSTQQIDSLKAPDCGCGGFPGAFSTRVFIWIGVPFTVPPIVLTKVSIATLTCVGNTMDDCLYPAAPGIDTGNGSIELVILNPALISEANRSCP